MDVVSGEWLATYEGAERSAAAARKGSERPVARPSQRPELVSLGGALSRLVDDIPELAPLLEAIAAAGAPMPEIDYVLEGKSGEILAEGLLHWPAHGLVIVEGLSEQDTARLAQVGFRALDANASFSAPERVLEALSAQEGGTGQ